MASEQSKDVAAAVAELIMVASQVTACAARAEGKDEQWVLRANGKLLARWASAIEAGPPERAARAVTALRRVGAGWLDVAATEPGALWARALAAVEALPSAPELCAGCAAAVAAGLVTVGPSYSLEACHCCGAELL